MGMWIVEGGRGGMGGTGRRAGGLQQNRRRLKSDQQGGAEREKERGEGGKGAPCCPPCPAYPDLPVLVEYRSDVHVHVNVYESSADEVNVSCSSPIRDRSNASSPIRGGGSRNSMSFRIRSPDRCGARGGILPLDSMILASPASLLVISDSDFSGFSFPSVLFRGSEPVVELYNAPSAPLEAEWPQPGESLSRARERILSAKVGPASCSLVVSVKS